MWPAVSLFRGLVSLQMRLDGDAHFPAELYVAVDKDLARVYWIEGHAALAAPSCGGSAC
jgi:hypothetical protein